MIKDFHRSFQNDLAKVISEHSYKYNGFENFGKKIGEAIAQEIEKLCVFLDAVKDLPDFHSKVREKYKQSKIKPKVYKEKGLFNCDGLFFEYEFEVKGGLAIVGFYLPYLFQDGVQEEELQVFTPDAISKIKNKDCIDFYFATYFLPGF